MKSFYQQGIGMHARTHARTHTHTHTCVNVCERVCAYVCVNMSDLLWLILIVVDQQTHECILNALFRRYKKLQGIMVPHVSYLAICVKYLARESTDLLSSEFLKRFVTEYLDPHNIWTPGPQFTEIFGLFEIFYPPA